MNALTPLETLFEIDRGREVALPPELTTLYGQLRVPAYAGRPYVLANFVESLDGVTTLNVPGHTSGGDISGFNKHDRVVMGLLRAVADAVVVGAGTLRAVGGKPWTPEDAYPPLADAYRQLRAALGKSEPPLNVIVTAAGRIDFQLPVFRSGAVPVLLVTTAEGARRLQGQGLPPWIRVEPAVDSGRIPPGAILEVTRSVRPGDTILVEGGPHLMADFFAERLVDDLYLTLAPQIAGRDASVERPGLVAGISFAPERPVWGRLVGIKRGGDHLFLRYAFDQERRPESGP